MERSQREAPAPDPLRGIPRGSSHPKVAEEPVLNADNIQGNIVPGFMKDHQTLVFLRIDNPVQFQRWLRVRVPTIATTAEVLTFNRLFKSLRTRLGREPDNLKVTWTNVAFTSEGLKALGADTDQFFDEAFREGLAKRSPDLGDPTAAGASGAVKNWLVLDGKDDRRNRVAHVLFIVAGDDRAAVDAQVTQLIGSLKGASPVGFVGSGHQGFELGDNLPANPDPFKDLSGHEHFGFLDGVSQPGIRGRISDDPRDVLTVRQNPNNRGQGKPGQDLIWPGEFVFGYAGEAGNAENDPRQPFEEAGAVTSGGPSWANDGSLLVFRRLKQDVFAFHRFLNDQAKALKLPAPANATPADLLGAKLVGRWRTGAPVERTTDQNDNPELGDNDCANNNFEFQEETEPLRQTAEADPFDCTDQVPGQPGTFFPSAEDDGTGAVCPFTGHIRKAYPRDDEALDPNNPFTRLDGDFVRNEHGEKIALNEDDTQNHRILRRGIPFGPASTSTPANPQSDGVDRGLHFLCYQTSITNQFEFIVKNWVNNPDFKEPEGKGANPGPNQPEKQGGGHDPIIGQNGRDGKRVRHFNVTFVEGGKVQTRRISTADGAGNGIEWVIPTGGGYFFAPSIDTLTRLAGQSVRSLPQFVPPKQQPAGQSQRTRRATRRRST